MDTMESLLEEIIDEATGKSRKKWALILVAMIAGAFRALAHTPFVIDGCQPGAGDPGGQTLDREHPRRLVVACRPTVVEAGARRLGGGRCRSRTDDLHGVNVALYQLS